MIAMGGVIGTGIFKGSADTIGLAGPGVIFSYVFAGLLLLIVMAALAEMAIVYPGITFATSYRLRLVNVFHLLSDGFTVLCGSLYVSLKSLQREFTSILDAKRTFMVFMFTLLALSHRN